jgi:hypothetical protein
MKYFLTTLALLATIYNTTAQNVGIIRENYFSSYFDSTLQMPIEVLDSSTVRLGTVNPITGIVSDIGGYVYNSGINLNGATINPYLNRYYIGKGFNFLTFDISSGQIINDVPISGSLPSSAFQNFRFNNSDSVIYGMLPNNYYSTYFDSVTMTEIEVLDSSEIRFAKLNPETGVYTLIGNTSYDNIYTLAGNSIDPYQMIYYYSAVDTLVGVDIYTGNPYSVVPIQLPANAIFENIAYSCADTSIYGITRRNYVSTVFDSLFMDFIEVIDSTTFHLSRIDPNTGVVTFISPGNIGFGGNLTGGAFIDPVTMTYYFSNGNQLVGASLQTGMITSSVNKTYPGNAIAFDMMRSTQNCFGATKIRFNTPTGLQNISDQNPEIQFYPNPAQLSTTLRIETAVKKIELFDIRGNKVLDTRNPVLDVTSLANGVYMCRITDLNGKIYTRKLVKN